MKTKLNVKLLRRIQKQILKEPTQFNMDWWFQEEDSSGGDPANCGTAACIGGWALALSRRQKPSRFLKRQEDIDVCEIARGLIRLETDSQTEQLFTVRYWPLPYRAAYQDAKTPKGAARAASRYIDHFIKQHQNA